MVLQALLIQYGTTYNQEIPLYIRVWYTTVKKKQQKIYPTVLDACS